MSVELHMGPAMCLVGVLIGAAVMVHRGEPIITLAVVEDGSNFLPLLLFAKKKRIPQSPLLPYITYIYISIVSRPKWFLQVSFFVGFFKRVYLIY